MRYTVRVMRVMRVSMGLHYVGQTELLCRRLRTGGKGWERQQQRQRACTLQQKPS